MTHLQALLIDRFKLKVHTEPREMQVYDLVIARSDGRLGPDIKPSTSDCSRTDELNATRADALAKGDLSAVVIAKPGQVLTCDISCGFLVSSACGWCWASQSRAPVNSRPPGPRPPRRRR